MVVDANIPLDTTSENPTQIATLYMLDMFGGYQGYLTSPKYADFALDKSYDFTTIDNSVTDNMKLTFNRGGLYHIVADVDLAITLGPNYEFTNMDILLLFITEIILTTALTLCLKFITRLIYKKLKL